MKNLKKDFEFYFQETAKRAQEDAESFKKVVETTLVLLIIKYLTNYYKLTLDTELFVFEMEEKIDNLQHYIDVAEELPKS